VISLTGCRPGKIRVINNPVSDLIRCKDKVFNNNKPLLLFIGSLPNKNLNRVIESIIGFPCTLNIVGHASESQQSRMKEYGIEYILERNISGEEIGQRYEAADIVLFPSLYEGFGLPVIEGFKAGRAVLTSDISPLKELSDGAAWLVDPYNTESIRSTLQRIVRDNEARNRKIEAGLAIVKNFSPEKIASLYQQAYSDLHLRRFVVLASVVPYLL
jgi:glycosyltransferase involved in cell wall biosynthesis